MWNPRKVASRITSRHHWVIVAAIQIKLRKNNEVSFLWNQITMPIVMLKALMAPHRGQGLMSTRWKGLRGGVEVEVVE